MTSNPITINAAVGVSPVYKGKALRSWAELPEEVVRSVWPYAMRSTRSVLIPHRRLIATYYLLDITASTYIPNTWEARRLWQSRMVYTAIRDSLNIEKHLMFICLSWRRASECLFFLSPFVSFSFSSLSHRYAYGRASAAYAGVLYFLLCCALPFMFSSSYWSWNGARRREFKGIKKPMSYCGRLGKYDTALLFNTAPGISANHHP